MSKQDVIDYVMETPHNTNRAVLEGLVDTAVEESQVQADWDQNDETAKDYIKNRICYTEENVAIELGTSYEIWKKLVNDGSATSINDIPLSIKYDGIIYKNIKPRYLDQHYYYDLDSSVGSMIIVPYRGSGGTGIIIAYPEKEWSFIKIEEEVIHKIPSKYIDMNQADWSQNDETTIDYVKNRTHYAPSEYYNKFHSIRLSIAGDVTTISEHSTIPFALGEEVHIFDERLKELTYEAPYIVKEDENGELYVGTSPFRIYRNKIRSMNSWVQQSGISTILVQREPAFKPGKQLDPKFIPEMYYTEENVTELGNTYEDWLTASDYDSGNYTHKPLSFLFDGQIYKDILPEATSSDFIHYYLSSDGKCITIWRNSKIFTTTPENTPFQIVKVNDNPTIHKIPSKYIDIPQTFVITPTYNSDTKTWSTDRTWDEVKAAAAKSENPNDYSINLDESLLSPNGLVVDRNGSGEIANVQMTWIIASPMVIDINTAPDGFGSGLVPVISYVDIRYKASSSGINFTYAGSGEIPQAIIKFVLISESEDGTLVCDPPNAVELFGGFLATKEPFKAQFICPLFYNDETYHYESFEKDSSDIVSFYFSTVSNSIYKRLKITQGQNGAADTVVMDKEINLNTKLFLVDFTSGPNHWTSNKTAKEIYDAANQGLRVVNKTYGLILINWHYNEHNDKYNLVFSTSGYTADNLIVAKLSATLVDNSFKGDWEFQSFDCDGIFNVLNDSDIKTGSILSVQAWNNHKPISWKAVDVLTTTNTAAFTPTADYHPATKKYVDDHTPSKISKLENDSNYITAAHVYDGILISSSTPNSTKKFKITVDDTGALTATGVTEA